MSSQISHNDNVELVSTFCIKCEKIHEISPIDICRNEVNKIKCECGFEIQVIQSDYLNRRAYKKEPKKKEKKRN